MSHAAHPRALPGDENALADAADADRRKRGAARDGARAPLGQVSRNTNGPAGGRAQPAPQLQDKENAANDAPAASAARRLAPAQPLAPVETLPSKRALAEEAAAAEPAAKRATPEPLTKKPRANVFRAIPLATNVLHDDLDSEDAADPLMVPEYSAEIFALLYAQQERYVADPGYMLRQPELRWKVRGILVNWMIHLHSQFRLLAETLLLAINLLDRYLERVETPLGSLQLAGVTCLFIAAKYEEVFSPSVVNYSHSCNRTKSEVLDMEREVLRALDFDLGYPNPMNFLRRISKADGYNVRTRTVAKYLLDVSLVEPRLMPFRASDVAAAAMCLSREMLGESGPWNGNLVYYSGGCTREALLPLMAVIVDYLAGPTTHADFFRKYASKVFMKASLVARAWAEQHHTEFAPHIPGDLLGRDPDEQ